MKLHIVMLLVGAITVLSVVNCAAGSIALVKEGAPAVDVGIPDAPNVLESWAADDLVTYLGKMAGVRFQATREMAYTKGEGRFVVYVGATAPGKALLAEVGELDPDEYVMAGGTDLGQLVIVGRDEPYDPDAEVKKNDDRPSSIEGVSRRTSMGTCRGVWHFLRDYGDVRWYLPTEVGEEVPEATALEFPGAVQLRKKPTMNFRDIRAPLNVCNPEFVKWHFRVGFGGAGPCPQANHSWHRIGPAIVDSGHNEFFAMRDGKTLVSRKYPVYLCTNAPGLPEFYAEQAIKYFEGRNLAPGDSYAVMPPDGYRATHICDCPLCIMDRKLGLRKQEEGGLPFHSQDYTSHVAWPLAVKGAELVKDRFPQHYVTNCSYATYGIPPDGMTELPDNIGVQICKERVSLYMNQETWDRDWARIDTWSKMTPNISIWEYYLYKYWANPIPLICPRVIAKDFQFLKGKVKGEQIQIESLFHHALVENGHIAMDGLNVYVTARFMEDPDQDIEQMLDEYYRRFYGPAERTMQVFYEELQRAGSESHPERGRREDKYELPFAQLCMKRLHEARQQVPDDSKYAQRIDMLIHDYQPWETLLDQKANPPTYAALSAVPELDSKLDDPCWVAAEPMTFYRTQGTAERGGFYDYLGSHCRIVYSDDALYLGVRVGSDEDPKKKAESFQAMGCSPEGQRYVLNVNGAGKASGKLYHQPENSASKEWSAQAEVADSRSEGEWLLEIKIPWAALSLEGPAPGWRVNARIVSHYKLKSPLILNKPILLRKKGKTPYVLSWQPEGQTRESKGGFACNPKYWGPMEFD